MLAPIPTEYEYETTYHGWQRLVVEPFRTVRKQKLTGERVHVTRFRIKTEQGAYYPWVSIFVTSELAIARLAMLAPHARNMRVIKAPAGWQVAETSVD
jgi:hypothetical protein